MSGRVHEWVRMREFSDSESEWWERERERGRKRAERHSKRHSKRHTGDTADIAIERETDRQTPCV